MALIKTILVFIFTTTVIYAKVFSLEEIKKMPSSYSRDYYIWRFLNETKPDKSEAIEAYNLTKRKSYKIKKAIKKAIGFIPDKRDKAKKDPSNFIIYPEVAAKRSRSSLKKLYKKILKRGQHSDVLKVMASDNPFEALKTLSPKSQCYIFNRCRTEYRKKYFNYPFSKTQLEKLVLEKQFRLTLFKIITTPDLDRLKKSLLYTPVETLPYKSTFLLAMNAVEFNKIDRAIYYLKKAKEKNQKESVHDKCNFWLYLLTKNRKYLRLLLNSNQINLFTLRARDILNRDYPKVITPNLGLHLIEYFDPYNPIDWEKIKIAMREHPETIEVLADNYRSTITEGVYCYLKEKASNYIEQYFPMPYRDAMIGKDVKRVALLYAIARQESRFVPASVSPSYALGMMQIMPFLIKHLSKQKGDNIDLDDIFDPLVAIDYADRHLNYLSKFLYHPLFIAYAYNGGIGFTKRTLRKDNLFKKGKYEPYLSMELIDYEESREYGKKVLTNYVIYLNLLGVKIRITTLLNQLDKPLETDKFR